MVSNARPGIGRFPRAVAHCGQLIVLVVTALVLCSPALATPSRQPPPPAPQVVDPIFRRLTVAQGLLHPAVRSILQDQRGFLWFGTLLGLTRYDGYTATTLASDTADATRLRAKWIRALAEDHDGLLWIGSYTDGLAAYDPRTAQFTRFPHDPQDATSPSADLWLAICRGILLIMALMARQTTGDPLLTEVRRGLLLIAVAIERACTEGDPM